LDGLVSDVAKVSRD